MLGFKLLASHLAIAVMGALCLILTLLFHESLSNKVFRLVLESSPRVELLHTIAIQLQRSQASLQDTALLRHGRPEERQKIWTEIWQIVQELSEQSKELWKMEGKVEKLARIKALLGEIYLQQWIIADTVNSPGDTPIRNLFHSQALPQAISMRKMIDALMFLQEKSGYQVSSAKLFFLLTRLRIALDSSVSALERIGYQNDVAARNQYREGMLDFAQTMDLLEGQRGVFTAEMLGIMEWLDAEQGAWMHISQEVTKSSRSVSRAIFISRLGPLNRDFAVLLTTITNDLKMQLNRDTAVAISQSAGVVWGSRFLVVLMIGMAIWIARRGTLAITIPLAHLDHAALEYAAGNLSRDIPEEGSMELKNLSRTFNAMRHSLQENSMLMHAVLETAADGIIRINEKGQVEAFNEAAERMFGWMAPEIVGRNVSTLIPVPYKYEHDSYIRRYLETREPHVIGIGRETQGVRKSGALFPIYLSLSHVEVNGRHIFTGIISDITEQKKYQSALSVAKDRAEAANRAKASFLANMSHEIRTPMNGVIGFADVILQDSTLSRDSAIHVRTIASSARALLVIINDILDVSKLESGRFVLERICFHLPHALQETLRSIQPQADKKNLDLRLEYDPALAPLVMGDPVRLRQVIVNLVGNAIKFTEKGYVYILVKAAARDHIHFSIRDSGIGMGAGQMATVFDSFTQADQSINRRFGGTGLGTTISKQLVELMSGKIWVESVLEKGSTFHFTVLLPEAKDVEGCLFTQDSSETEEEYHAPRIFRVLLAEDVETNATLVILRLEQQGHSVRWVKDGRQVVAESRLGSYDLILMDIQMPELDGLEATRVIRDGEQGEGNRIPIVALTAGVMQEDYEKCEAAGMDYLVEKPIDFAKLFTIMEEVVPQGGGQVSGGKVLLSGAHPEVDFSPLSGIVDYEKALRSWQVPRVYLKALVDFAGRNLGDAREIKRLLQEGPDGVKRARVITHTLKGVSGNLAIYEVARLAAKLDGSLQQDGAAAVQINISALHDSLNEAGLAIANLKGEDRSPFEVNKKEFDAVVVGGLLVDLGEALGELNPDVVEPLLDRLAYFLERDDLAEIRSEVDFFEFDKAHEKMQALVRKLHLNES